MFPAHPELIAMIVDWYVTTLIKTPGRAQAFKDSPAIPPEVSILETMDQLGGAAKIEMKLHDARQRDAKATMFSEALANVMGYEHLLAGDTRGAVEILKLNAVAYPNSANAHDSLADAYLADGQRDLARQNAKKAIDLLASDTTDPEPRRKAIRDNAEQKLKQLAGERP